MKAIDDVANYEIERFIDSVLDGRPTPSAAARGAQSASTPCRDFRVPAKAIQLMKANVCERISFDDVSPQRRACRGPHSISSLCSRNRPIWTPKRLLEHAAHGGSRAAVCSGRRNRLISVRLQSRLHQPRAISRASSATMSACRRRLYREAAAGHGLSKPLVFQTP